MTKSKKIGFSLIAFIVLVGIFLFGRYFERHKDDDVRSMNDLGISIPETSIKAFVKGDTNAYHDLQITYLDYSTEDFLPIALEMANTQNYPPAYYDVYFTLTKMENLDEESDSISEWETWNPRMQRIAFEYLLIGAKLGDSQSIETLKNYYIKNKRLNKILLKHRDLISKYSVTLKKIEHPK